MPLKHRLPINKYTQTKTNYIPFLLSTPPVIMFSFLESLNFKYKYFKNSFLQQYFSLTFTKILTKVINVLICRQLEVLRKNGPMILLGTLHVFIMCNLTSRSENGNTLTSFLSYVAYSQISYRVTVSIIGHNLIFR